MCDDFIHPELVEDRSLSRRTFGLIVATAAGAPALALSPDKAVEKDVVVKTPDGACDAALFYPKGKGRWPAVLIWPDIMGLRPALREMGRRLASQGYVVLVPNPFYRSAHAPVVGATFDFNDETQRKKLFGYRAAISDEGIDRDARAHLAFLDAQSQTDRTKRAGVQGYCMGGTMSFRTAAAIPARIAAVGSFHGGNSLVTAAPNSPHLLIAKTNAAFLVCQARNDDAKEPGMKDALKAAFVAAHRSATVDIYAADHGWCVPGGGAYDHAEAERAWAALTALYRARLV